MRVLQREEERTSSDQDDLAGERRYVLIWVEVYEVPGLSHCSHRKSIGLRQKKGWIIVAWK
jgi:hypothetical protein